MGGDVAGGSRVGVVPPGPADAVAAVEDQEVVPALTQEADRRGQPRQPAADHQGVHTPGRALAAGCGGGGGGARP